MVMKKSILLLMTFFLITVLGISAAEAYQTTINVATEDEIHAAVAQINAASSGEFIISLQDDIDMVNEGFSFFTETTKTILGNEHTITFHLTHTPIFLVGGTLNLGNADGNVLILTGPGGTFSAADGGTFIQVNSNFQIDHLY